MKEPAKNHIIGVRVNAEKLDAIKKFKIDAVALFREALDKKILEQRLLDGECPCCGQKVKKK